MAEKGKLKMIMGKVNIVILVNKIISATQRGLTQEVVRFIIHPQDARESATGGYIRGIG